MNGSFWRNARKMGRPGFLTDSDALQKLKSELPQQAAQNRDKLEEKKAGDQLPGGKADGVPDSRFPKADLRKGEQHEREHTKSPSIAREIAKDHLAEDKDYYDKLEKIEK